MKWQKFSYESMGTHWEVFLPFGEALGITEKEILSLSNDFDHLYSRFKPSSLVTKISEKAGTYEVPEDFINMLKLYFDLYQASEKKLNPLIGFTISDLGYDNEYTLQEKETVRKVPDLIETVKINGNTITTAKPVLFDFGALGKGYFVDKIAALLKSKDFTNFLVNGSGDIYYFGEEKEKFGLEDPEDSKKVIAILEIGKNLPNENLRGFCASGTNRRKWPRLSNTSADKKTEDWNHVIDPITLEPADFIVATWVQAESTALADALASCLFLICYQY